ncbi:MAG: molecular chaperone HtpG [Oscillospiraceae bacterium]|nr:molecular chaperone HtpG [Oscillospiraceae bacterium]
MDKKQFKAESKRLLDLMINSIYTHKEIFLRELISNSSDAIDKLCYISLTDPNVGLSRSDFAIDITIDKESRIFKISDNGIGMTQEELELNLGTIAQSGSLEFRNQMEKATDEESKIDIIGKFGVGFYSAFMVSEDVKVLSRAYGKDDAYIWESEGADGYTVSMSNRDKVGTDVILTLKEDTEDEKFSRFLETYTIENLVKKYSDYIRYPIRMEKEKYDPDKKENAPKEYEIETLNSMVPIWQRNKNELKDEDYENFYKDKFFDFENPLKWIHVDAEGVVTYKSLLFIPSKASYDFYTRDYKKGLQLYSSGVLIMDKCEDLIADHFRFVRGVVDSPDLSLNISREMLQHSRELKTIANNLEKKIKAELLKMLNTEREKYEKFYKAFGLQLKYGIASDYGMHKDILQDLLLFPSSNSEKLTTLSEYVSRMKEGQKNIYFATGDSIKNISNLPQAELVREKGYEILYFTDEIDEFAIQMMRNFETKEFKSINSDDLDLISEEAKKASKKKAKESKDLLSFVKECLNDKVKEVKISEKLKNTPVCITASGGLSFEMEKYLNLVQPESEAKADRVLELNPDHKLFTKLNELYTVNKDEAKKYVDILYNQALLMAGLPVDDPVAYSNLLFELI